ncbi:MAG TPA: SRPBCC family protein [Rhizomicrobium sp.]
MASIRKELHLNAPAARVWEALADFHNVHTRIAPGFVTDSKPHGEGARIVTFANGSVAKEILVSADAALRRLVYTIPSERMTHHSASAEIVAAGEGCRFIWTTDVQPDAVAPYIDAQMSEGAKAIRRTLER